MFCKSNSPPWSQTGIKILDAAIAELPVGVLCAGHPQGRDVLTIPTGREMLKAHPPAS